MKNKIEDLRNHLFEVIEALKDEDKPMDISRAKAVAEVAQVMVETAKVECEYLKITGNQTGSGFIPDNNFEQLVDGETGTRTHKQLRGV